MTIQSRKERTKAERRKRIMAVAMRLFKKGGIESVSMRAIASKIDYSPTTIYRDFKDKKDVLFAMHSEGFELLIQRQLSVQSIGDPAERLAAHGHEYVKFALENPEYYDLMFINHSVAEVFAPVLGWKEGGRSYDILKQNIKDCMQAGYFPGEEPDGATFAMWAIVHGIASLIIRSRLMMVPGDYLDKMVEGALHVLRSMIKGTKTEGATLKKA
jgi:AcrR family transcriptional regulator